MAMEPPMGITTLALQAESMEITQTDKIQEELVLPLLHLRKEQVHLLWELEQHKMDLLRRIITMQQELRLQMDKQQHLHRPRMVRMLQTGMQTIEIVISRPQRQLRVLLRTQIQMRIEQSVITSLVSNTCLILKADH